MKTIPSPSLETSLELELWSLFLPSGFNTAEWGGGGSGSPHLPEQWESNSLELEVSKQAITYKTAR